MKAAVLSGKISNAHNEFGVGLIEVLVTLIVLSIGLLGFASLQIRSVQMNQSTLSRTQAINAAYDIVDRIMVNKSNGALDVYEIGINANPPDAPASITSVTERAQADLNEWFQLIDELPSGDASLAIVGDYEQLHVTVCWDDERGFGDSESEELCGADNMTSFQFWADI